MDKRCKRHQGKLGPPAWRQLEAWLVLALALSVSACGLAPSGRATATALPPGDYPGVSTASLGPHHSTFIIEFSGDPSWRYELDTRRDGDQTEWRVNIEGITGTNNPGDVRVVASHGVTKVLGPGTGNQCLQYPSDLDINVPLLSPDDLIDRSELTEPLVPLDGAEVAGRPATHYALVQPEIGIWQDAQLSIWLDRAAGELLRFELAVSGWDTVFQTGLGQLQASYQVVEFGPQVIEPVEGCRAEYPVPAEAERLVLLPQYLAFESDSELEVLVAFYQAAMAEAGWQNVRQEARQSGAVVIQFRRGAESAQVSVRQDGERRRVEVVGR